MDLLFNGPLLVECDECRKKLRFNVDEFFEETSGSSRERGMGYDLEHIYSLECQCSRCKKELYVSFSVLEYPIGAIDSYYDYCRGCRVIDYPDTSIDYSFDFNDYDERIIRDTVTNEYSYLQEIISDPRRIESLSSRQFEELVADVFYKLGYEVELTKQTRDGGRDVIATKCDNGLTYMLVIECKHYSRNRKVSVSLVRELSAVRNDNKANKALLVTSSFFSRDARLYANESNKLIELIDVNRLMDLISQAQNNSR